ncbi:UPF0496 protein 4-like [Phoenix dactylifera]|uniref:UPF0496 protein 4-like n=1 Tax=Phoenix dactylifera TaxID=42345 RepID=A0A8B8ZZY0_PHODC|nr:UPF0496 protein 4-like [Phoenix dactylifera]
MSLTVKCNPYLSIHAILGYPSKRPNKTPSPSRPFEEILILRLRSLLPIPKPPPSISFHWLSRAVDLLALTLADAAALFSDPALSGADPAGLASHLDASVSLLDACNAASAEIERLRRGRLRLRFSLHLLAGDGHGLPPSPDRVRRARKAIEEWETLPRRVIRGHAGNLIRRLAPGEPPRGKFSAVRRALYAVEGVACLVMAAIVAVLSGGEQGALTGVRMSDEFPWGEAFDEVRAAVSGHLGAGFSGEVEAVEAAVRAVVGVIDGEGDEEKPARLGSAVVELEKATEELTYGLDRLSDAVNALFRAAMNTRDAALHCLRILVPRSVNR